MQRRNQITKLDASLALEIAAIDVAMMWIDSDLAAEMAALDAEYAAAVAADAAEIVAAPVVVEVTTPAPKMPVDRAALAKQIAAVANSVSGVKANPWTTPDGKVCRVYFTFTRKANGGAGWNGGVGAKAYLDISVENADLIAGGDMSECATLDVPNSAFAGAATRDMLRRDEMRNLDSAFTDAGLCIVVE